MPTVNARHEFPLLSIVGAIWPGKSALFSVGVYLHSSGVENLLDVRQVVIRHPVYRL